MDVRKRDEMIKRILEDKPDLVFAEDLTDEYAARMNGETITIWVAYPIAKQFGRELKRRPPEPPRPITSNELARDLLNIERTKDKVCDLLREIADLNDAGERVADEQSANLGKIIRMEAQDLLDSAGSLQRAIGVVNAL